jgi:hypothetical protein
MGRYLLGCAHPAAIGRLSRHASDWIRSRIGAAPAPHNQKKYKDFAAELIEAEGAPWCTARPSGSRRIARAPGQARHLGTVDVLS